MKKKKIIYISNVNIDGIFLPGVINKIKGQELAFKNSGYEIDLLYPGNDSIITIKKDNGEKVFFKGARDTYKEKGIVAKAIQHYKNFRFGTIDFSKCVDSIIEANYDVIYMRFYLPGRDTIRFLKRIKKVCPNTLLLLEYPTSNFDNLFNVSIISRIGYFINRKKIQHLNKISDYLITLTKDATLYGRPTIFMANGITIDEIRPVDVPPFTDEIVLLAVASDAIFSHGFDKVIKGLSIYTKEKKHLKVVFNLVSNPLSKTINHLKILAKELEVENIVRFESPKSRKELSEEYKKVHVGIGSLAAHRLNLKNNYSLKHREYGAFGLPFVMCTGDEYFENSPFVMTVESDEQPLDIQQVVDFYCSLKKKYPTYPQEFRKSVEGHITWDAQLKNVFAIINKA